ncbi:MAG: DUF2089 domain-containing protein [Anaerolineales bacterium]
MHPVLGSCPVCGQTLAVTRLHCHNCDTTIEGQFSVGAFDRLSPEQLAFAEAFFKNEGKLNRLEKELGLSYPTLRARLTEVIRAMGFEVGQEEPIGVTEEERRRILDELASGRLSSDEAVKALQGG